MTTITTSGYQADLMQYNIMATAGLVISENLVSSGRIPTEAQVTTWITNALELV